jgi:two-component system response regulator RegA
MKIMIVDDDATFRSRLVSAMSSRGLSAAGASSPDEAKEVASRLQPDRAVLDLRMPGGSGLDLVKDLLTINSRMEIVILTGYGSIATALQATRFGAVDYLTKPADADQILAAFDKVARRPVDTNARDNNAKGANGAGDHATVPSLARVEWEHIQRILTDCGGNISRAARVLGIHRRSLQRKLSKYPPEE